MNHHEQELIDKYVNKAEGEYIKALQNKNYKHLYSTSYCYNMLISLRSDLIAIDTNESLLEELIETLESMFDGLLQIESELFAKWSEAILYSENYEKYKNMYGLYVKIINNPSLQELYLITTSLTELDK